MLFKRMGDNRRHRQQTPPLRAERVGLQGIVDSFKLDSDRQLANREGEAPGMLFLAGLFNRRR